MQHGYQRPCGGLSLIQRGGRWYHREMTRSISFAVVLEQLGPEELTASFSLPGEHNVTLTARRTQVTGHRPRARP